MKILSDWECKYCGADLWQSGGRCFKCGMRQGFVINLKDFDATEAELDTIYSDSNYDGRFFIIDSQGDLHKVSLVWEQGRGNNYRFVKGDDSDDIIWPNNVTRIEVFKCSK